MFEADDTSDEGATFVSHHPPGASGRVLLAEPRSYCAGVDRAIMIVERALEVFGPPVYVRKEIVHNHHVVRELARRGAVFVDSELAVPPGSTCVFSAHGVSPEVRANAAGRDLNVIDATCPLVAKVHAEVQRFARDGRTIILIGHAEHEEVEGTYGEAPDHTIIVSTIEDVAALDLPRDTPVAYTTQTTLSLDETAAVVDALRDRFDDLVGPGGDDICYASQNRQNAIKAVADRTDLVLVIGSANSSNSVRMVEVAQAMGVGAYLVPDVEAFDERWLEGVRSVGVSAGASAPETLVDQLVARLAELGYRDVEVEQVASEQVVFTLPAMLRRELQRRGGTSDGGGDVAAERVRLMKRVMERIDGLLAAERDRWSAVDRRATVLLDAVADLIGAGGKRLRPEFLLTGFLAAGGGPASDNTADTTTDTALDRMDRLDRAVEAAAAVEFLHTFALLHDDVLDDSPMRRGRPTAHEVYAALHHKLGWRGEPRRYGEGVANLAGDLAHIYADRLAHGLAPRERELWAELKTEVIIGQSVDIAVAAEFTPDPAVSRWIADCKSGRYSIQRPLQLGAAIAGRHDLADAFATYGHLLGEAFQLRDDLIDAFGDSAESGKPTGLDFADHKMTLLMALAAERDERVMGLLAAGRSAELRQLLDRIGIRGEVEGRIDQLVGEARRAAMRMEIPPGWRRELAVMADRVAYRAS
jgi:(E)-4-hydroxy-3-methyl-but-2-enyl pyrophosphate reductase